MSSIFQMLWLFGTLLCKNSTYKGAFSKTEIVSSSMKSGTTNKDCHHSHCADLWTPNLFTLSTKIAKEVKRRLSSQSTPLRLTEIADLIQLQL